MDGYNIIEFDDNIIGKKFQSKQYGEFYVIGATNEFNHNHRLFCCQFISPFYIGLYRKDHILSGSVKNPYYPIICGVACIGNQSSNHFLYGRWASMISRCYDTKSSDYRYYGGCGVTVCKDWLCFEKYCEDVVQINGYSYDKVITNKIELDKDYYGKNLYSPTTTIWLDVKTNKDLANQTQIDNLPLTVGISPNGERFTFHSQSQFAKEHKLLRECIARCVRGEQKTHLGWTFYSMKETCNG